MEKESVSHEKFVETVTRPVPVIEDDEDDLFCKSLAKQMKSMQPEKRAFFRMKVSNLMYEVKYNQQQNAVQYNTYIPPPTLPSTSNVQAIMPPSASDYLFD